MKRFNLGSIGSTLTTQLLTLTYRVLFTLIAWRSRSSARRSASAKKHAKG